VRVAIFDDMLAARGEVFHIPGLEIEVHGDGDQAENVASSAELICMDYAMGGGHRTGAEAVRALRDAGYRGRIVAMSSDPAANRKMIEAGADEALAQKAMLRSFLVALGKGV
jgi:DNA-binding NarL/FixJ family response regulator